MTNIQNLKRIFNPTEISDNIANYCKMSIKIISNWSTYCHYSIQITLCTNCPQVYDKHLFHEIKDDGH